MNLSAHTSTTNNAHLQEDVVVNAKPVFSTGVREEAATANDTADTNKASNRTKQLLMKPVNKQKNVAIIGMHPVACIGVEALLKNELGVQATIWPFQSAQAMDSRSSTVDLVICELDGSGALGIERQLQIARNICGADTPVLILSEKSEMSFGPICIAAGAHGFVSKSNSLQTIAHAIETVLHGKRYISAALAKSPLVEDALTYIDNHQAPIASEQPE